MRKNFVSRYCVLPDGDQRRTKPARHLAGPADAGRDVPAADNPPKFPFYKGGGVGDLGGLGDLGGPCFKNFFSSPIIRNQFWRLVLIFFHTVLSQ